MIALSPKLVLDALAQGSWPSSLDLYKIVECDSDGEADEISERERKTRQRAENGSNHFEEGDECKRPTSGVIIPKLESIVSAFEFLSPHEFEKLFHIGSKVLIQQLFSLPKARIELNVASQFKWKGSFISKFTHATSLSISAEEYYEHMNSTCFDPSTIPTQVKQLRLNFRNSTDILKLEFGGRSLRDRFPRLEEICLNGVGCPKVQVYQRPEMHVNTLYIPFGLLNGLIKLDIACLEVAIDEISNFPKTLLSLSTLHIKAISGQNESNEPLKTISWPPHLQSLAVVAYTDTLVILNSIAENCPSIRHLTFSRDASDTSDISAINSSLSSLPKDIESVTLEITGGAPPTPLPNPISSLSGKLNLSTFHLRKWPTLLDPTEQVTLPPNLRSLRLYPIRLPSFGRCVKPSFFEALPHSLTDLFILGCGPSAGGLLNPKTDAGFFQMLPPLLTRMNVAEMLLLDFALLPKSVTDLKIDRLTIQEEEPEKLVILKESGLLPVLRHLHVAFVSFEDDKCWQYLELFPTLVSAHVNLHAHRPDWDRHLPPASSSNAAAVQFREQQSTLVHYSDGFYSNGPEWEEMNSRLPRNLKSYRLPSAIGAHQGPREHWKNAMKALTPNLTALDLYGMATFPILDFLPKNLVYLSLLAAEDWNPLSMPEGALERLPKTLRTLRSGFNGENHKPGSLPPYCTVQNLQRTDDPLLSGEWWRA